MAAKKSPIFTALIFILFFVLGYISFTYLKPSAENDISSEQQQQNTNGERGSVNATTIGNEWSWGEQGEENASEATTQETPVDYSKFPFTKQSVYDALQAVKVDADGNLILDNDAMIALDEALERIYNQLGPDAIAALQQLILDALPGITGEQTAELVADYAEYLKAKEEFSALHENQGEPNSEPSVESLNNDAELYEELQALRTVHLGNEAAKELFRVSDAAAEYMFASMKLSMNDEMSTEQMMQEQQRLHDKQISQALNIVNWDSRYATFKANKQSILNASISQAEKEKQLNELLQQQFTSEEAEKMRYFGLDQAY